MAHSNVTARQAIGFLGRRAPWFSLSVRTAYGVRLAALAVFPPPNSRPRHAQTRAYTGKPTSPAAPNPPTPTPTSLRRASFYDLFPETLALGAPPAGPFRIDVRALRREFLRLQASAHPDFHHAVSGTSSTGARAAAEVASAGINEAFRTLASPLLRAQYLLRELHGIDLAGDEAGASARAETDVLAAVLEARESIEAAEREEDLEPVRRENEERIARAEDVLGDAFKDGHVERAVSEAVRMRYWVNIRESVHGWEKGTGVVLQH